MLMKIMKWLWSVILFGASSTGILGHGESQRVVVSRDQAYALLPPVAVAPSGVQRIAWSPDSRYLVVVRNDAILDEAAVRAAMETKTPMRFATVVSIWSCRSQKSTEVIRFPSESPQIELVFLKGTDSLLITVSRSGRENPEVQLLRYSIATRRLTTLVDAKTARWDAIGVSSSPILPLAIVNLMQGSANECRTIGSSGGLGPVIPVEDVTLRWSRDGRSIEVRSGDGSSRKRVFWNILTATSRAFDEREVFVPPDPLGAVGLELADGATNAMWNRDGVALTGLWLVAKEGGKNPAALIAAQAEPGHTTVAQDLSAAAYVSEGVAFVRPIMKLSGREYEESLSAAERTKLLRDAKVVGTAIQMYLADHDDRFPDKEKYYEQLAPYLKNNDALGRFVYVLEGVDISKIGDPSKTVVGYIEGPGGRAVSYADGSARWIRNSV